MNIFGFTLNRAETKKAPAFIKSDWASILDMPENPSQEVRIYNTPSPSELRALVRDDVELGFYPIAGKAKGKIDHFKFKRGTRHSVPGILQVVVKPEQLVRFVHSHTKQSVSKGPSFSDWIIANSYQDNILFTNEGVVIYGPREYEEEGETYMYDTREILDFTEPRIGLYDLPDLSAVDQFARIDPAAKIAKIKGYLTYDFIPWEDIRAIQAIIDKYLTVG